MILQKVPLLVWFLIPTLVIVGVGVWFFTKSSSLVKPEESNKAEAVSTPVLGTVDYDIVSRTHISQGTSGSGYNSNPPSSGPHWQGPAKNGFYYSALPDQQLIHNLEHGHIWIAYKPDAGDEIKSKLKEIAQKEDWKVVVAPREANDSRIALVAWGRVLKMDEPDYTKIEGFIRTYRNRSEEKTPE